MGSPTGDGGRTFEAGGRSSRMFADKAWVDLAGRPLIAWVLDALQSVTRHRVVVAREEGRLPDLGVPLVFDRFQARSPATGIHAGLRAAPSDLSVVVAGD